MREQHVTVMREVTAGREPPRTDAHSVALMDYLSYLTARRIAKLLFGLVVSLVVGELGVRLLTPQIEVIPRDLVVPDSTLGFRMVPNYRGIMGTNKMPFVTNSWGLRDRELGEHSNDVLRIYILGDSVVFGLGVPMEDTFTRVLEGLLQQRLGRKVEVVNGGVPAYGTLQELALFERTASRVRPDLVLLGFTVLNDFQDDRKFVSQRRGGRKRAHVVASLLGWLRAHSQLFLLVHRYGASVSPEKMMKLHAVMPSSSLEQELKSSEDTLERFSRTAHGQGAGFGLFLIPSQRQVSPAIWTELLKKSNLSADCCTPDEPNARLAAFARERGIPVLDLLPVLRSQHGDTLYANEHWIRRGHSVVAKAIADFLVQDGLLGAPGNRLARGSE